MERLDPHTFDAAFLVEHADIPVGLTIAEYRRARAAANRRPRHRLPIGRAARRLVAALALAATAAVAQAAAAAGPQPEPPTRCPVVTHQLRKAQAQDGRAYRRAFMRVFRSIEGLPADRGCGGPDLFLVDRAVRPAVPHLKRLSGAERPVARIASGDGARADFVAGELLVTAPSRSKLAPLLERYDGEVLKTIKPGFGMRPRFIVRIDPPRATPDTLSRSMGGVTGAAASASRVSDTAGLRTLAAAVAPPPRGLEVEANWVLAPQSFATRSTREDPSGPAGFNTDPAVYTGDAYDWTHLMRGSGQNIGVTEAWTRLDQFDRLGNHVKVAILDMGFSPRSGGADLPAATRVEPARGAEVPNSFTCGGAPCPWHGTNVASAAAAVPDNGLGAAGPGGPVVEPLLVPTGLDVGTTLSAFEIARRGGARIINISASADVPLGLGVAAFDAVTAHYARAGILIFAAAGNDGEDVDHEECFLDVCFEPSWFAPCENTGVICVGGLATNSVARAPRSNYGRHEVDLFAPYTVLVGPDPGAPLGAQAVSGTSVSSPYAAGVAALVLAADPRLSADQVERILRETSLSRPYGDVTRVVNARRAVDRALPFLIRIVAPADGTASSRGARVDFEAELARPARTPASVVWTLEDGTELGRTMRVSRADLPFGSHVVTVTATYSDGTVVSDSAHLRIVNDPPAAHITFPGDGTEIPLSQPNLMLHGYVQDANEPGGRLAPERLTWHKDGSSRIIGTGPDTRISTASLGLGRHTITLRGSDGMIASEDSVTITVVPPDGRPGVTIVRPFGDSVVATGYDSALHRYYALVTLQAEATDPEDGVIDPARIVWRESGGGAAWDLARGNPATVRLLAGPGCDSSTHHISVLARDSDGHIGSASIDVTVYVGAALC